MNFMTLNVFDGILMFPGGRSFKKYSVVLDEIRRIGNQGIRRDWFEQANKKQRKKRKKEEKE